MHAEIRLHHEIAGQAGRFAARRGELEAHLESVAGVRRFELVETREGIATVLLCDDAASVRAASDAFRDWVRQRLPDLAGRASLAVEGPVLVSSGSSAPR